MKNLNLKKAKFGSCCMFVPLDSSLGVKLYAERYERDISFFRQKKASKLGLGPKTFKRLTLNNPIVAGTGWRGDVPFKYGFITEKARQYRGICRESNPKLVKLHRKLEKHGFMSHDVIGPNIGYIGKKLVCIDFDIGSMG